MFRLPPPPQRLHEQHHSPPEQHPQLPDPEHHTQLPRGECRFILLHPETSGQRCSCQGFWLNQSVPGSSCVCGHQACYHVPDIPSTGALSHNEHLALVDKLRRLELELEKERADREEDIKGVYRAIRGVYHNHSLLQTWMSGRLVEFDDKIDGIVDKSQGFSDGLKAVSEGVGRIDDSNMELENRVEEIEADFEEQRKAKRRRKSKKPSLTKSEDYDSLRSKGMLLPFSPAWTANVIFVPSASQLTPFPPFSNASNRCRSRGLHRRITIRGWCSRSFAYAIETAFSTVLADRRWLPLVSNICSFTNGNSQTTLQRLPDNQCCSDLWDAEFIKSHCAMVADKEDVETIYVALRNEDLTWAEIKKLPVFEDLGAACWEHDETLDGQLMDDEGLDVGEGESSQPRFSQSPKNSTQVKVQNMSSLELLASLAPIHIKRRASMCDQEPAYVSEDDRATKRMRMRMTPPERQYTSG
ncbi:MAG: hypothetical protein M1836_007397 [Candelina mexicana]|nr:MAG: hypothetical protein M1836_007397 [Candelina mexicana]